MSEKPRPLTICLIDMNDGHPNQAMRCLRLIVSHFRDRVLAQNPNLSMQLRHISPRNREESIPYDADLYLSSGGPGSPFDDEGMEWRNIYGRFLDDLSSTARAFPEKAPSLFLICYSFEYAIHHFGLAKVQLRDKTKFGVMPIYTAQDANTHPLMGPFHDRLFAFEHRSWEAVDLDHERLAALGGKLLAQESRDGHSKGRAILGLDFGPGIEGVQFHPEADRAGVLAWVARIEHAKAFRDTYGDETFRAMLRTLDNPLRLARTFELFIPRWMQRRFNAIADDRGWNKLPGYVEDPDAFEPTIFAQYADQQAEFSNSLIPLQQLANGAISSTPQTIERRL